VQVQDAEAVDLLRVVELAGAHAKHPGIGEAIGDAEAGHDLELVNVPALGGDVGVGRRLRHKAAA